MVRYRIQSGIAHHAIHRSDVDNPTIVIFLHDSGKGPGNIKYAAHISGNSEIPLVVGHIQHAGIFCRTGTVDQNINFPKCLFCFFGSFLHHVGICYIAAQRQAFAAHAADLIRQRLQAV